MYGQTGCGKTFTMLGKNHMAADKIFSSNSNQNSYTTPRK